MTDWAAVGSRYMFRLAVPAGSVVDLTSADSYGHDIECTVWDTQSSIQHPGSPIACTPSYIAAAAFAGVSTVEMPTPSDNLVFEFSDYGPFDSSGSDTATPSEFTPPGYTAFLAQVLTAAPAPPPAWQVFGNTYRYQADVTGPVRFVPPQSATQLVQVEVTDPFGAPGNTIALTCDAWHDQIGTPHDTEWLLQGGVTATVMWADFGIMDGAGSTPQQDGTAAADSFTPVDLDALMAATQQPWDGTPAWLWLYGYWSWVKTLTGPATLYPPVAAGHDVEVVVRWDDAGTMRQHILTTAEYAATSGGTADPFGLAPGVAYRVEYEDFGPFDASGNDVGGVFTPPSLAALMAQVEGRSSMANNVWAPVGVAGPYPPLNDGAGVVTPDLAPYADLWGPGPAYSITPGGAPEGKADLPRQADLVRRYQLQPDVLARLRASFRSVFGR